MDKMLDELMDAKTDDMPQIGIHDMGLSTLELNKKNRNMFEEWFTKKYNL